MKKLRKELIGSFALLSALLPALLTPDYSYAASGHANNDIGFYVSAQIPDNQIDHSLTYFDLHMQPAQEQTLAISVTNSGAEPITVEVSAISASTNQNGIIDYRTRDIRDETLRYPFSELASVAEPVITIPAYESKMVHIDLTMPNELYDGIILGGIVIAQKEDIQNDEMLLAQGGSSIINHYAYIVGVKLTETDVIIPPAFELIKVIAETIDYRPALVHYLRNTEAAIVKNMAVSVIICPSDNAKPIYENQWNIDMAPNSTIRLPAFIDSSKLQPGTYNSQITTESDGSAVILDSTFTIEQEQVNIINSTIIEESVSLPLWSWIIIMLVIIIAVLIIFLIVLCKRRKDDEEQ